MGRHFIHLHCVGTKITNQDVRKRISTDSNWNKPWFWCRASVGETMGSFTWGDHHRITNRHYSIPIVVFCYVTRTLKRWMRFITVWNSLVELTHVVDPRYFTKVCFTKVYLVLFSIIFVDFSWRFEIVHSCVHIDVFRQCISFVVELYCYIYNRTSRRFCFAHKPWNQTISVTCLTKHFLFFQIFHDR